jgi:hypothetical protein
MPSDQPHTYEGNVADDCGFSSGYGADGDECGAYEKIERRQPTAVEHDVDFPDEKIGDPRLIVGGTGARKTNTLVHRVAHLILSRLNRHHNKKLKLHFSKPKVDAAIKAGYE